MFILNLLHRTYVKNRRFFFNILVCLEWLLLWGILALIGLSLHLDVIMVWVRSTLSDLFLLGRVHINSLMILRWVTELSVLNRGPRKLTSSLITLQSWHWLIIVRRLVIGFAIAVRGAVKAILYLLKLGIRRVKKISLFNASSVAWVIVQSLNLIHMSKMESFLVLSLRSRVDLDLCLE